MLYIIVLLFLLILFYFLTANKIEHLNTFNGRMSVNDQYFYDKLFDDVIYFPTIESNNWSDRPGSSGYSRCMLTCPGNCVEYGVSGNAYCFK